MGSFGVSIKISEQSIMACKSGRCLYLVGLLAIISSLEAQYIYIFSNRFEQSSNSGIEDI